MKKRPEVISRRGRPFAGCYAKTHAERNGYMTLDDVLDQSRLAYFLRFLPHNTLGKPAKLVRAFGRKVRFEEAMRELQDLLYQD